MGVDRADTDVEASSHFFVGGAGVGGEQADDVVFAAREFVGGALGRGLALAGYVRGERRGDGVVVVELGALLVDGAVGVGA